MEPRTSGFAQDLDRPPGDAADEGAGSHLDSDLTDPLSLLPEVARKLVLAARHVILTKGFSSLTISLVAQESGENRAMTAYYFGNKAGLIAAVLDSLIYDEYIASIRRLDDVGPSELGPRIVEEMSRRDARRKDQFRIFFELFPHAVRSNELRNRLKQLYRWYFEVKLEWLRPRIESPNPDNPAVRGLLELLSAVIDGLAIQDAIGREGFDISEPFEVLAEMLEAWLPRILSAGEMPAGHSLPDGPGRLETSAAEGQAHHSGAVR